MHFHPVMREARRIAVSMCRHGSSFACRHDASVAPALAAGFDSRSATNWRRVVDSGLVKLGGVDCQRRLVHLAERERDCTVLLVGAGINVEVSWWFARRVAVPVAKPDWGGVFERGALRRAGGDLCAQHTADGGCELVT